LADGLGVSRRSIRWTLEGLQKAGYIESFPRTELHPLWDGHPLAKAYRVKVSLLSNEEATSPIEEATSPYRGGDLPTMRRLPPPNEEATRHEQRIEQRSEKRREKEGAPTERTETPSPTERIPEKLKVRAPDLVFEALAGICQMTPADGGWKRLTATERGMLNRFAGQLRQIGATPEEVQAFGLWWRKSDWRGKQGQVPTPAQVVASWTQFQGASARGQGAFESEAEIVRRKQAERHALAEAARAKVMQPKPASEVSP
jgi:hypothetical protein